MSHTLGRARGSFCLGPSGPPRQALPQPYQDMTLLRTLPLWQPGFQQQFCLLGPQELGDLACGRAACWETGPAMEVNSCPRSVVCMGLGGLGSSTGPGRRSGVDLGRRALLRTRGNHLPGAPVLWVGHSFRGRTASSQPSRREGPALTSQLAGYAVGGLGHAAGPAAGAGPRSSGEKR